MGIRRDLLEALLPLGAVGARSMPSPPPDPTAILVLRNNDIGDLLVITPLFEALKRRFPNATVTAGIGDWNRAVLENNPWVSNIAAVNGPWHNRFTGHSAPAALTYLYTSNEVAALRAAHFDIGIDVLGSRWGALLLCRADIPYRMGVRGYAGGHSLMQAVVPFRSDEHVGRMSLHFAEQLGAVDLPPVRPQLYLTDAERRAAETRWASARGARRIVIASGGGLPEKCWPIDAYRDVVAAICREPAVDVAVIGGPKDARDGEVLASAGARNWAGQLSLRESFAVVAQSDFVITAPSMTMHVAAAFEKPTVVMLGPMFDSADDHERQWGYPGNWCNLGRDAQHRSIWTSAEALEVVLPKLRALTVSRDQQP